MPVCNRWIWNMSISGAWAARKVRRSQQFYLCLFFKVRLFLSNLVVLWNDDLASGKKSAQSNPLQCILYFSFLKKQKTKHYCTDTNKTNSLKGMRMMAVIAHILPPSASSLPFAHTHRNPRLKMTQQCGGGEFLCWFFRGLRSLSWAAIGTRCRQVAPPDKAVIWGVKLNEGFGKVRGCQRAAAQGCLTGTGKSVAWLCLRIQFIFISECKAQLGSIYIYVNSINLLHKSKRWAASKSKCFSKTELNWRSFLDKSLKHLQET